MALQAMESLAFSIDNKIISEVLDDFVVEGRLEVVSDDPIVILDVGHNPHASRFLAQRLKKLAEGRSIFAVFSALADKDVEGVISPLSSLIKAWHIAPLDCARARDISDISNLLAMHNLTFTEHDSLSSAYDKAIYEASGSCSDKPDIKCENKGIVICFGSFHVVSEIKQNKIGML